MDSLIQKCTAIRSLSSWSALSLIFIISLSQCIIGCGPRFVRGGESPDFERAAMSTRLDRTDLNRLFAECSNSLIKSKLMRKWSGLARDGREATVAILPIANETSEHVEDAIMTLIKKLETELVNEGEVTVVSRVEQPGLLRELRVQQGASFDPQRVAQMGRQLGAQYLLTGRVYAVTEKGIESRRVQYFLFMQVIEVETGAVRWQKDAEALKGITAD